MQKNKFTIILIVIIMLIIALFYSITETRSINNRALDLFFRNLNINDEISHYINSLGNGDIVSEVHYLTLINNEIRNCSSIYLCNDSIGKMDSNKYMLSFISSLELYSEALQKQYFDGKNELIDFQKVSDDVMEIALIIKDFDRNGKENFDSLYDIIPENSDNDILKIYFSFLNDENIEFEDVKIPYK